MLVEAGKVEDFEEKTGKFVKLGDQNLAVFKYKGKYYAVDNKCPHQGCPLSDASIEDRHNSQYIVCSCHGWEFKLEDGSRPAGMEGEGAKPFKVTEKAGKVFVEMEMVPSTKPKEIQTSSPTDSLRDYLGEWQRKEDEVDPNFAAIQEKAITGKVFSVSPMSTLKKVPKFDEILFRGAQLTHFPLLDEEEVNLETVLGKTAKKPLEMSVPFFVSHMSFGALSKEAKTALAMGASAMGTAIGSGEGGILPEEKSNATKYIYEYTPAPFTQKMENVRKADAIEIKFGQGTKPGMGGHLTKAKITPEISDIRKIPNTEDYITPARFSKIKNQKAIKSLVVMLRKESKGKPIGIKVSASHVTKDVEIALKADPDYITIDGRGGGTGASVTLIKDNYTVPSVVALAKASQILKKKKSKVDLVITGGLRDSMDIGKALAMGATTVALATASLMAIGCQQYRICHTDNCPVGITTQKEKLRKRFDIEKSKERLVNYFTATKKELELIAQTNGKNNIHKLSMEDIFTLDWNFHKLTGVSLP